ncbi:LETM1 and EF-hand domain-containing protein anon-60Da [Tropilaelaps mercedesae]|uniref:Mitochondrial proton/calcium exchanger protein n=1 Tax=Tropilaelaps mercedesae TaxID=418985 RepID=A0A1V9XBU6_9ACAR|nr:LETM1 and EF-hand domain-containing protein anon-60Da [Tropilaelaps mercedesae]
MYRLCLTPLRVTRSALAVGAATRLGPHQLSAKQYFHRQSLPSLAAFSDVKQGQQRWLDNPYALWYNHRHAYSSVVPKDIPPSQIPPPPISTGKTDEEQASPSSKVETTVKALLKDEIEKKVNQSGAIAKLDAAQQQVASPPRPLWKRVWDELVHYYHGFRLLFIDIRVCSRLLYRILNGQDLTRREHKQLVRTTSDLFRLVPFSVFIIVPFMELLLPVAVKLFPNMLPSTFMSAKDETKKIKAQLKMKLEMAKFLQTTLDEMAVTKKGETHSHAAKEFAMFCEKIRESGSFASSEEILKFSKLFEDELTLDSLDRQQLVALCRLLDIPTLGTTQLFRFQLRMRLKNLKNDDALIKKEGIDSLTVQELQAACRARGMRSLGVPEAKLRYQLNQWLDLSLRESIPPSMLLLSRAMLLPEYVNPTEQLREIITQLPKQAITEAKYKIGEVEGKVDNRTKLEIIRQEELAIKEEQREEKRAQMENQAKEEEAQRKVKAELKDIAEPIALTKAEEEFSEKTYVIAPKGEQKLSKKDLDELEDALETISAEKNKLLIEKEEIEELKKEVQEYEEDLQELVEVTKGTGDLKEAKGAHRLYKKVNSMIKNLDTVIEKLTEEKQELKEKETALEEDKVKAESVRDDIIGINELVLSMRRLQKTDDGTRIQMIQEVLDTIDSDHDGKIEIDLVLKVIDAVGRENVKVSPTHMKEIIELMLREETIKKREKEDKELKEKMDPKTSSKTVPTEPSRDETRTPSS